jgi:N-acetylmuramoyl-L-alanine amidase
VRISSRPLIRVLATVLFFLAPPVATSRSAQDNSPTALPAGTPGSAPAQTNGAPPTGTPPVASEAPTAQAAAVAPVMPVVVINPAHGGTDPGARGQNGTNEKDIVLQFARTLRGELDRQGFRAILTRNDDSNPSYDDRAAAVNAYRDAIFISLHVSSTGTFGAVRAYYSQMASEVSDTAADSPAPSAYSGGLVLWNEAQRPYLNASRRLATLIQIQCAQGFGGSPYQPQQAPIRELRSIEAPGVAIELSSVSGGDSGVLLAKAAPLATAISHGIQAFRADNGK